MLKTNSRLTSGTLLSQSDVYIGNSFDGIIDKVKIYNKVLTASEIAALASG